jgi:hypothetical protein
MDIVSTPFAYPSPTHLLSPQDALTFVANKGGCSFPARDLIDQRLITELRSFGTSGQLISDETASPMNGPGSISGGNAPIDTDGDGIPDDWERANGLNPQSASDAMQISSSGYANIELYLNSLVSAAYP